MVALYPPPGHSHRPVMVLWSSLNFPLKLAGEPTDRKSTRLNSSHANISYAVLCLKKIELGEAAEQFGAAGAEFVDAGGLGVGVLAGEGALGAGLPEHRVRGVGEQLAQLGLGPSSE